MHEQQQAESIESGIAAQSHGIREVRHGFRLGDCPLLLPGGTFSELTSQARICTLPDTPQWFAGYINHRGHTVPVFDLQPLLGGAALDARQRYWILLIDRQPRTAGLLLRQFPQVLNDPAPARREPITGVPEVLRPFLQAACLHQGECWHELDHRALLGYLKRIFHRSDLPAGGDTANDNDREL